VIRAVARSGQRADVRSRACELDSSEVRAASLAVVTFVAACGAAAAPPASVHRDHDRRLQRKPLTTCAPCSDTFNRCTSRLRRSSSRAILRHDLGSPGSTSSSARLAAVAPGAVARALPAPERREPEVDTSRTQGRHSTRARACDHRGARSHAGGRQPGQTPPRSRSSTRLPRGARPLPPEGKHVDYPRRRRSTVRRGLRSSTTRYRCARAAGQRRAPRARRPRCRRTSATADTTASRRATT